MQKNTTKTLLATLGLALAAAAPTMGENILFQDDFSGLSTDALNGTTPDVTQGATAWVADAEYAADGSAAAASDNERLAYLSFGSLLNDNRGSADAIYTLSVTLDVTSGTSGQWGAIGFYNTATVTNNFASGGVKQGVAWMLRRDNAQIRVFRGPGTADGLAELNAGPNNVAGQADLQVILDLSDWDGATNFGSVTYNAKLSSAATFTEIATGELDALSSTFGSVGLGGGNVAAGISSFQLTQVPEPGSLALLGLGGLLIARRRRG